MLRADECVLLAEWDAVFVDIAKNASSSIKTALAPLAGVDLARSGGDPHRAAFPRPPAPDPLTRRWTPPLWAFAIVRNPWDRLVSCYRDKVLAEPRDFTALAESGVAHCLHRFGVFRPAMPFAAFVEAVAAIPDRDADEHFRSQHVALTDGRGDLAVDYVGRFERLTADFAAIVTRLGLPEGLSLPRLQAAPSSGDYRCWYDAVTRDVVAERYAGDVARFGYTFE